MSAIAETEHARAEQLVSSGFETIPPEEVLSFDDGPAGAVTEGLLLVLREFGVKASFCVVGLKVVAREYPIPSTDISGLLCWPDFAQAHGTR